MRRVHIKKQNVITISIILLFILVECSSVQQRQNASWSNYDKDSQNFRLSNPSLNKQIQIVVPLNKQTIKTEHISISEKNQWRSVYSLQKSNSIKTTQISIFSVRQQALVRIINQEKTKEKTVIILKDINFKKNQQIQILISSSKELNQNNFKPIQNVCSKKQAKQLESAYQCSLKDSIFIKITKIKDSSLPKQLKKIDFKENFESIQKFLKNYKIIKNQINKTEQLVQRMITETLSSLCVTQSKNYKGQYFYGFCSSQHSLEIQSQYSMLVLEVLLRYNYDLATWLIEQQLNFLEQALFYSFDSKQWIKIPQHIEICETYLEKLHLKQQFTKEFKQLKINKVLRVMNGLINNLLLSEVNHLSQEINYRQNNKIHPTIMKMLTQTWKSNSPKAKASSRYAESFTPDFYYHQSDEELQNSIGKTMWLIKLLNQYTSIIKIYGQPSHKEQLQELISLSKVLYGSSLDDPRTKEGMFNSIIISEKLRVYSRSIGYESLLPYIYEVSPVFPTISYMNLTSQYGLTSLPSTHEKFNEQYDFRGNINLYFNYKILFSLLFKSFDKEKKYFKQISQTISTIQEKIYDNYSKSLKSQNFKQFQTSWTLKGVGRQSEKYLAIINAAFLTDLKEMNEMFLKNARKQ